MLIGPSGPGWTALTCVVKVHVKRNHFQHSFKISLQSSIQTQSNEQDRTQMVCKMRDIILLV